MYFTCRSDNLRFTYIKSKYRVSTCPECFVCKKKKDLQADELKSAHCALPYIDVSSVAFVSKVVSWVLCLVHALILVRTYTDVFGKFSLRVNNKKKQ